MDLAIVIVSYNTLDLLRACLASIPASVPGLTSKTFVVDNASPDGSAEMVAREFPEVELTASRENLGFTRGNNLVLRRNEDSGAIALREFTEIVYGKATPYGWRPEFSTVNRINRSDVQAFHRRHFFPANVILGLRGDFLTEEMKARLDRLFASWSNPQEVVPPFPEVTTQPAAGLFFVDQCASLCCLRNPSIRLPISSLCVSSAK